MGKEWHEVPKTGTAFILPSVLQPPPSKSRPAKSGRGMGEEEALKEIAFQVAKDVALDRFLHALGDEKHFHSSLLEPPFRTCTWPCCGTCASGGLGIRPAG